MARPPRPNQWQVSVKLKKPGSTRQANYDLLWENGVSEIANGGEMNALVREDRIGHYGGDEYATYAAVREDFAKELEGALNASSSLSDLIESIHLDEIKRQ